MRTVEREFNTRFSTTGWLKKNCRVSFSSERYSASLHCVGDPLNPAIGFKFSERFELLYAKTAMSLSERPSLAGSRADQTQETWLQTSLLLNSRRAQANVYIPAGRTFFIDPGKTVSALQNPDLDQITRQFAARIPWDPRWKVGLLTTGRDVLQGIEREIYHLVGGAVAVVEGKPLFVSSDGRTLPLSLLSSGTSEMLPLFALLDYLAFYQEHFYVRAASTKALPNAEISGYSPLIYLEEPEANIFPDTQRELVNLFAWMANDPVLSFDWVITTHSPYVLTAFNTLIEAWRAAKKTGKREQVAAIVPEHSWISEDDFAAYTIQNHTATSIFRKEAVGVEGSGLINGDYLDHVSDTTSNQFSRLVEIEFADTT